MAALDGLRSIAIALVMADHALNNIPGAWIATDIFFVLSGFLITSILHREYQSTRNIALSDFYIRRFLRLGPALIFFVFVYLAFIGCTRKEDVLRAVFSAIGALTFTTNWVEAFELNPTNWLAHTWSLANQEIFYIVWPLCLPFVLRTGSNRIANWIWCLAAAVLACIAWRWWLQSEGATPARLYYSFDTRFNSIIVGCAIALWLADPASQVAVKRIANLWPAIVLILVAMILRLQWNSPLMGAARFTVVGLVAACLVVAAISPESNGLRRFLSLLPLVVAGRISYGLYLWHMPIFYALKSLGLGSRDVLLCGLVLTALSATLSFFLIERPSLRLGRFIAPDLKAAL